MISKLKVGQVKWFGGRNNKGPIDYGFLTSPDLDHEIFVHRSGMRCPDPDGLAEGTLVLFKLDMGKKGSLRIERASAGG